jgi:benzoyl-CoA 2,3-epoxidase subunit A
VDTVDSNVGLARQHVIDPEICIRCNTCEATCPIGAVTHNDRNYVVKFEVCNACNACISPCPTGAIDNWRQVLKTKPYTIEEQLAWESLPSQEELDLTPGIELPSEVLAATAEAVAGQGGAVAAPWSAAAPRVGIYSLRNPATAKVTGNLRLTGDDAGSDIRHIVLHFGALAMPVLEGQTVGIVPPGADERGRPHHVRLYSVASPRDGERSGYNNFSLTVKRVAEDHQGRPVTGLCSNYLCDLKIGDEVKVVGPYGTSFLMPNHPGSHLMMICTGTGSAPMRAMTERRRRRRHLKEGGQLMLFFGARSPGELPYFGPLQDLPKEFIDINLAFSRVQGMPKRYVQDLIRERATAVSQLLKDANTYIYVCGLKAMEEGVLQALRGASAQAGLEWDALSAQLKAEGRLHLETY